MLGGVALACAASGAEAADARVRFAIPNRAYADALIDLGLQANVSVLGTASCGARGRVSLSGLYTVSEALRRLLADAPCRYQIVDARTVRILPGAPAAPAPLSEAPRPPALVSEVVVTATKRPVALDRLPAGASAVSRDQIEGTRAIDVGQTVGQLAGVLTTNLGPGRDKLLIRGLSDGAFTGRTRSTVGTYLDDAPINYNAPDPDLRLVDVDRVEVVRGPQGALYGSGAIAGIYRIVTTKPDLQDIAIGGSASFSQTRGGGDSHELDGYLNLPIIEDRVAIRLVAYDEVQGGYLDDMILRVPNVDQTRRDGGRLAVRVRFDDTWRLDAQAATQHLRSDDTQYVRNDAGSSLGPLRRNRIRETHNNDFSYGGATLHGEFDWGSLTSSVNYVHHVFSSQFDASEGLSQVSLPERISDLGAYLEATRSNMLVQDLVVRSSGRGPFDWLIGVYAARTVERSPSSLSLLGGRTVSIVYIENRKDRLTEYAVYGEGSYVLGAGWSVTFGGRLFQSRVRTTADLRIVQPYGPRFFDRARTFDGFSPKLTLQREFRNGDLIYGLVTEGYRPGGFNSSGFNRINEPRATFAPDRLRNYEVGVKLRRFDGRLGLRAAAYYNDWTRIQTDQYRPSGLAFTGNVGDARIAGLEAEVGYTWPFGLAVQFNGLLSDSEIRNPNATFSTKVAEELPGVPTVSGGVLAIYQRPLGQHFTFRLTGEASYVGSSSLSFDTALPVQPRTDNYLRSKLSAELATRHWRVAVFVNNPIDDNGDTFAYGNPFSFSNEGVRQATPQRPRTVGVRLGATF